jgi:RNA-directed DNA polymerase
MVDLAKGGSFTFLGFEYRRILSRNGVWRPYYAPKLKKRTALSAKLREVFRRNVSQPVGKVIDEINPILRGWANYFRVGIRIDVSPWSSTGWKRRSGGI